MITRIRTWTHVSAVVTLALTFQVADNQGDRRREDARRVLQTHLTKYESAAPGELRDLKFKPLGRSYPRCEFFTLRFPRYPVEVAPPEPLKSSNVFAVCGDQVTLINDEQQLEKFFTTYPPVLAGDQALADATRSWLYVVRELQKDGFFEFARPSVTLSDDSSEGVVEVVEKRGDQGKLTVHMELVDGKLKIVRSVADVQQGIRPRCQARRLLDNDPAVREIMKRDILVMGSACKPYLDEVRADASPELRQAIDEVWRQIVDEGR